MSGVLIPFLMPVYPGAFLPFHAEAADRARVASMPDTAWPVSGHPPGSSRDQVDTPVSMSPVSVSTRQQRFAHARLPDPHLTRHARLFHIAHHGRVAAPAACGGLKPPPAGRLRRADNPSSPAQHRFTKLSYIELPSTFGTHPQTNAPTRRRPAPTRPPQNRRRHRHRRCRRLEFTVDRHPNSTRIGTRSLPHLLRSRDPGLSFVPTRARPYDFAARRADMGRL